MASLDPRTPVLVGAGQVVQRPGEGHLDPIGLAVEALRRAADDSGAGERLLSRADSARHVATASWAYRDEAALVAEQLGLRPRETVRSSQFGGDGPGRLLGDTARAIQEGEVDVAVLTGAEAIASQRAIQRDGGRPDWPEQGEEISPTRTVGADGIPSNAAEQAVGLIAPIYNYALLETAVRARSGLDPQAHLEQITGLWSRFSQVAAKNPYAWLPRAHTAAELATPSPDNRPVSAPYLKLLSANLTVDLASGLILCSAEAAEAAGVPRDRWVFVHAAAHATDEWFLSERAQLAASPAIAAIGRAALGHAGINIDQVARIDLYSCFPSAVQIAAAELGVEIADPGRPLTVTGGLTFGGGPGNNYAAHAIATLVPLLRDDPDAYGISTALGWYATKHAIVVMSGRPPRLSFADLGPEIGQDGARAASAEYEGSAAVEAYTVPYGRDGDPQALIVSALAPDGSRALARSAEPTLIAHALAEDPLGWEVEIGGDGSLRVR